MDASLPVTRGDRRPKVVEARRGRRRRARGSLSCLPSATAAAALVRPPGLSGVRAGVGARPDPRGWRSRRCRVPSGPGRRKVACRQLQGRTAAPPRAPQTAAPPASSQRRVPAIRGRRGASARQRGRAGSTEGHRRACERPPSLAPQPRRASRQVRALTPASASRARHHASARTPQGSPPRPAPLRLRSIPPRDAARVPRSDP